MMKTKRSTFDDYSQEELEIAQLLYVLPHKWYLLSHIPFNWVCRKKRSTPQETTTQSPSSSSQPHHGCAAAAIAPSSNAVVAKEQASSPTSPLLFPPTESDEKIKHSSKTKTSLKWKRENYLQTILDLTKTQADLNREIENVKRHRDQLKAFNLKLKERKQQLCNNVRKKAKMEIRHQNEMQVNGSVNNQKRKQPMVNNNNNMNFGTSNREGSDFQFRYPTTSFPIPPSSSSSKGPLVPIPDLNLSIDELAVLEACQPLDESAAKKDLSRAARQRRLQIFRLKNNNSPFLGNNNAKFPRQSYRRQ